MTPVRKVAAVLGAGALIVGLLAAVAYSDPPDQPSDPIVHRGDRYQPEPAGTKSNYNFWFGPYTVPPGHDLNRIDVDVPLENGLVTWVEPHILRASDLK